MFDVEKLSISEIARRFGVTRQGVQHAITRSRVALGVEFKTPEQERAAERRYWARRRAREVEAAIRGESHDRQN